MFYLATYLAVLVVFGVIDAAWLTTMGAVLYRPVLGDILAPSMRIAPALVFYLLYPVGLVVFAVIPALRAESAANALLYGALFGAIAYATYDLTNYATLRNWSLQITVVDIGYGAIASGIAATAAYFLIRAAGDWIGNAPS
jgi:uncharacterized membrane protein